MSNEDEGPSAHEMTALLSAILTTLDTTLINIAMCGQSQSDQSHGVSVGSRCGEMSVKSSVISHLMDSCPGPAAVCVSPIRYLASNNG